MTGNYTIGVYRSATSKPIFLSMICLAIDTAGTACAACLLDSETDRVLAQLSEEIGKGHAERLMGIITDVMCEAGVTYPDVDRVVTTIGPGSFTGIRVGVATARGFALGLGIPVVGVTNLEVLKLQAMDGTDLSSRHNLLHGIVMQSGRSEAYCQFSFDLPGAKAEQPFLSSLDDLADELSSMDSPILVGGSAAKTLKGLLPESIKVIDGCETADIALVARLGSQRAEPDKKPEPLYLRKPDAVPQRGFAVERAG